MAKADAIVAKVTKQFGAAVARVGVKEYEDTIRIPTGIFQFDLASGGGFPRGRSSIIYGPESSNKTNVLLLTIRNAQRMWPDKKAVFVDVEHSLDPVWAAKLGVDMDSLIVIDPDYAEQAIDLAQAFLHAEDVSIVGLDSIAALTTQNEAESSAEKASVGGASNKVGGLYRKVVVSFQQMRAQGILPPAFVAINQIRHKIGVMYGNPETMPGGYAPKFASALTVRTSGKNLLDKAVHTAMPFAKDVHFIIQKWKVPILAVNGTYVMNMLAVPTGKYAGPVGHVADWNTLSTYLQELDYLAKAEKQKDGWTMFGKNYPTADACRQALYSDESLLASAKQTIISELMNKGQLIGGAEQDNEETPDLDAAV